MAMNPREMVTFFQEQAELFSEGLEMAMSSRDYWLAADNLSSVSSAHAMAGLIQWRHQLEDPRVALELSVRTARTANERLSELGPSEEHWKAFPFHDEAFLEILLTGEASLLGMLPVGEPSARLLGQYPEVFLDVSLIGHMYKESAPEHGAGVLLSSLGKKKRLSLLCATYENYLALVRALNAGSAEEALLRVNEGLRLFSRRRRNSYYAGGVEIMGGDEDNDHVVEFVLSAIMHRYSADNIMLESPIAREHAWRW